MVELLTQCAAPRSVSPIAKVKDYDKGVRDAHCVHTTHDNDQDHAFPISMAALMVYGMELYNHVLMSGELTGQTLLSPFSELVPMAAAVLLVEGLLGGHIVGWVLAHLGDDALSSIPKGVLVGSVTCAVMCPLMSMVATLAFKHPTLTSLAPLWFQTFVRNLPFALLWALLVARPVSGLVAGRICGRPTAEEDVS